MGDVFASSFAVFFNQQKCTNCHATRGVEGIAPFADSDLKVALNAFAPLGPDPIINKLKSGHQGFSYSVLEAELLAHKAKWEAGVGSSGCDYSQSTKPATLMFFQDVEPDGTQERVEPIFGETQTIFWDMSHHIEGLSFTAEITVQVDRVTQHPKGYWIGNFKAKSEKHKVKVSGITVFLNGDDHPFSTFSEVSLILPKTPFGDFPITAEGQRAFVKKPDGQIYTNEDQWVLRFDELAR